MKKDTARFWKTMLIAIAMLVMVDITVGVVADIEFSAPFYWKDTIVRRYPDGIGLKERILIKSSIYRYNGKYSIPFIGKEMFRFQKTIRK